MRGSIVVSSLTVLAAAGAAFAQAGGTITDGNAVFRISTAPTTGTGTGPTADFRVTGAAGTDHVFQNWWWFRLSGDTRETTFNSSGGGATSSYAGNFGQMTQFYPSFRADMTWLVESTGASAGFVRSTMSITNTTSSNITINMFNYFDADMSGTAGGDTATLAAPNLIEVIDGTTGVTGQYSAVGADAYQVTAFAVLRGLLANTAVDNLNNSGLPFGPGDFTGGYQWTDIVIEPGFTRSFVSTVSIPTPGSLALLALAGLAAGARRRR